MLRKSVGAGLPRRFLDSIQPPGRWRAFVAQLDTALYDPSQIAAATKAALDTFEMFEFGILGRVE
jgi:heme oxygenase